MANHPSVEAVRAALEMTGWEPEITIYARRDRPMVGFDTTILVLPDRWFIKANDGTPVLYVTKVMAELRCLAEQQAQDLGEQLHHGEFVMTRDPEVIRKWGLLHDCASCRAAVDQAVAHLEPRPGNPEPAELVLGHLYWAG